LNSVEFELGREFSPVAYPSEEFEKKARTNHHFIAEIIKGPKIWLIGNEDEGHQLAKDKSSWFAE
jgi:hypothetical protein